MISKSSLLIIVIISLFSSCKQNNKALLDEALALNKNKDYEKAIIVYNKIIMNNNKIQLAFYNRGLCHFDLKHYSKALNDFNRVIALQTLGNGTIVYNQPPLNDEERYKYQVPYLKALYQRAQVKYFMDSLASSFQDFQILVDNNYDERSNCTLWQGTIYKRTSQSGKACKYFEKAKQLASDSNDIHDAEEMIAAYCDTSGSKHK